VKGQVILAKNRGPILEFLRTLNDHRLAYRFYRGGNGRTRIRGSDGIPLRIQSLMRDRPATRAAAAVGNGTTAARLFIYLVLI
jgi:hypothetical protein